MDRADRNRRRSSTVSARQRDAGKETVAQPGACCLGLCQQQNCTHCSTTLSGTPAVRPNTPVLPYGTSAKLATFVDPTAKINNGYAVIVGAPSFIAPYASLNAHGGIIKIGSGTDILDNASVVADPLHPHAAHAPQILIGDHVLVSYGARILGASTIGAYGSSSKVTEIGPGAVIDQANVEAGAIVSALAQVGPGVTVPSGYLVLPGKTSPRMQRPRIPHWEWSDGSRAVI